jgi:NAD(P)-dependent dehydrogenase (short-subunit alcohol dehydrogenase family)
MGARKQPIALVTGASRGVGRGVVLGLVEAGFCVYATGRSIAATEFPEGVRRLPCDHLRDEETDKIFQTIEANGAGWTCSQTARGAGTSEWSRTECLLGQRRSGSSRCIVGNR